jgi:Ran GTPase-activating protein (RanGAP) involved in mRNA processing and transport
MSKILTKEEAEKIVRVMLDPLGFVPPVLDEDPSKQNSFRACNAVKVSKTIGYLWWKKKIEVIELDPIWTGWCWEEVIEKMDLWVQTRVKPRLETAEKFRDKYARQEANEALEKVLETDAKTPI